MRNKPRLVFLLNSAQRHLAQWIAQQASDLPEMTGAAPSPAQSAVLFLLARSDGLSMGELADGLDLAPSAVTGLVQRMEAAGLAERRACPTDARAQRVWLRPQGQALLPVLQQATQRINARLTDGFTPEEIAVVGRWLSHVRTLDRTLPPED